MSQFTDMQDYARHLKSIHSVRNRRADDMEDLYLMRWDDEDRVKRVLEQVKLTKSPSVRNFLMGALRLLVAADPVFSVPREKNSLVATSVSDKLERAAVDLSTRVGRLYDNPYWYEVVLSMLLWGESHLSITRTEDMVAYSKGAPSAYKYHIDQLAARTPYVIEAHDPRLGYPDLTNGILTAFYQEAVTTAGACQDQYPGFKFKGGSRYATATLCHFWDSKVHYTWVQGESKPLVEEEHGLPFIPFVVKLGEGSRLFSEVEDWRQPFLYTVNESHLWERENLLLTVLYTTMFAIGSNPIFVEKLNESGAGVAVDFNRNVWSVPWGADIYPMLSKGVIDPSFMEGWAIAEDKIGESTISAQTLGEPLGVNAPFSMVALLHQAGRLPLVVPQRKASQAIAEALKMCLVWMKEYPLEREYEGGIGELTSDEIPDYFDLDCKLDIALPQDQLQSANTAALLTQGENPVVSNRYVQEKVLGIEQPGEMQKEIWTEKASAMLAQKRLLELAMEVEQMKQQFMQPPQPPAPPAGPPMQPGMPPGMPPEMMPPGGMPPEQMLPPEGMPPGMPEMGAPGGGPPMPGMPPEGMPMGPEGMPPDMMAPQQMQPLPPLGG